jgi:hypothetical protein
MPVMLLRRWLTRLLLLLTAATVVESCGRGPGGGPPTLLPPPDLRQPAGAMTRARMQMLVDNPQLCRIVLEEAQVRHSMLPGRAANAQGCGYPALVRRTAAHGVGWAPDHPATGCAVAAALHMWERDVLQPAARRHLGQSVTSIRHFGSYSCRNIGGGSEGRISEHARANAIDIAGFRLANGREVSVLRDWRSSDAGTRAFLRDIRDGACRHFSTVLSPDYNQAHADHFHFDQARRGSFGFCR